MADQEQRKQRSLVTLRGLSPTERELLKLAGADTNEYVNVTCNLMQLQLQGVAEGDTAVVSAVFLVPRGVAHLATTTIAGPGMPGMGGYGAQAGPQLVTQPIANPMEVFTGGCIALVAKRDKLSEQARAALPQLEVTDEAIDDLLQGGAVTPEDREVIREHFTALRSVDGPTIPIIRALINVGRRMGIAEGSKPAPDFLSGAIAASPPSE